jgi:GNAT superfamily N-acetyltransferase
MIETIDVIEITDTDGRVIEPEWLARAESVHRELRPQIEADYRAAMRRVFAGGARQCIAAIGDEVAGVAVYRIYENTFEGMQMYVDDLVTHELNRSRGIGKRLLDHLAERARGAGCVALNLDSGTQRREAHRFYFRERMAVTSFHFSRSLSDAG